ncbi:hypothetical protein HUU62_04575 [Rhodoferax sp. 4810]|nr:hypothetical protein [Rhodoferax jenense]
MISRPLDPGEAFFFLSDHVSCMNFVVLAERSGTLQPERIRRALDTVQQEHALLQTRISWTEDTGLRFEPAPGAEIELLCHQSSTAGWSGLIEQELANPFALGAAPLMRCLYIELAAADAPASPANAGVLALTFHHSIADGRSGTEILRRLLSLMATEQATTPSDQKTHLPSMAELMPAHYRWAEQPEAAKQLRTTLITDYRRHGVLPVIPWLATEAAHRTPRLIRLQLSADASQQLLTQARAHGTTVHGALCAAQLLAQYQLQQTDQPTAFFLSCPVDLRPHLQGTPPTSPTGFYTSLISGTFQISADTDLWALAREIMAQTRTQIARGEGHLLYHLYGLDGSPVPPQVMESFRKKALASLPNTMISNVGAIAPVADDPAVQAISFALCPMPYQTLFTAASSYKSCLIMNVGYDAARITPATAQALVLAMQETLENSGQKDPQPL